MTHDHHSHHHHHHSPSDFNRAFALGVVLNMIFVGVEAGYGVLAHSLVLIADAGHNLSDVVSLLLAWGANVLAGRKPSTRRTYGFRRATILASLFSSLLLLTTLGGIVWEAIGRIEKPAPVSADIVMVVAGIGVVINTLTALLFASGRKHDLNIKGAFLHMAADAAVSLGVVLAGLAIMLTGHLWIDPAISLVIVSIILIGTLGLLRDSLNLAIDAVPPDIDPDQVRSFLLNCPGVEEAHDFHIWGMSTTQAALTVHLVMPDEGAGNDAFLHGVAQQLHDRFGIGHATIQVERGDTDQACKQARAHCI